MATTLDREQRGIDFSSEPECSGLEQQWRQACGERDALDFSHRAAGSCAFQLAAAARLGS